MAFGHKSIPAQINDIDPVENRVIITNDAAIQRGLGSYWSKNIPGVNRVEESRQTLEEKEQLYQELGFDDSEIDEIRDETDDTSDEADEPSSKPTTSSNANPFILSYCTSKTPKTVIRDTPKIRLSYKRVRRPESPSRLAFSTASPIRTPSTIHKVQRITSPNNSPPPNRFRFSVPDSP